MVVKVLGADELELPPESTVVAVTEYVSASVRWLTARPYVQLAVPVAVTVVEAPTQVVPFQ